MAIDGCDGNEGIVFWLGQDREDIAEITHLVRLRGPLVVKHPEFVQVHPSLFNEIADIAIAHRLRLIGQVHTHGPDYRLDLSPTDRQYGIKTPSYLSLVAPNYGRTEVPVHHWGVHIFEEGLGYVRMRPAEAQRRIQVVSGPGLPFLTVGGG
jgi:proteasome lid subunit RPN8/RPN11